jgi:prophage maintenance system killer protein
VFTNREVEQEYERWRRQIGPEDPYVGPSTLGIHDVLKAHFYLQDYFFEINEGVGGIGPRDLSLLHSALSRQFTGYEGRTKWNDPVELCATLFYGIIRNHPFHDCNKRTALLSSLLHLEHIHRVPEIAERDYEDLAVRVADRTLNLMRKWEIFAKQDDSEVRFLAWYFRNNSRKTNKREYFINFQQLEGILKRFHCRLGPPDNNFIHIQRQTQKKLLFGIIRSAPIWQNVVKVRFPGMKSEVANGDLRRIRQALELTPENGVDSEVFFKGRDPVQSFISKYERPLRRLAFR